MSSQLKLFDLHSRKGAHSWSINPWKARMLLNYKGLSYKTQWVEVCDNESVLKPLGVPPNEPPKSYTMPALDFGDGTIVQDSWKIAQAVEEKFPSRPVPLHTANKKLVEENVNGMTGALIPVFGPRILGSYFSDRAGKWYFQNRFPPGLTLEEMDKVAQSGKPWEDIRPNIEAVVAALKKNTDGPFFEGNTFTYADVLWATFVHFTKCAENDLFPKVISYDDVIKTHYAACEQWFKKDD